MTIINSENDRYLVYYQFPISKFDKDKDLLRDKFINFIMLNDQDKYGNVHNVFFCEKLIDVEFEEIENFQSIEKI